MSTANVILPPAAVFWALRLFKFALGAAIRRHILYPKMRDMRRLKNDYA
ncbi:hypothetical protein HDC35_000493 [Sphingopyxis sp. JAI128]|nr:hypothetical protein [Sphingopyxis sp. JAI128]